MDGKENQDPTSSMTSTTTADVTEDIVTTEQQQQQLSPTDQSVRKSISPQEYIRQKQNEKETTTPTPTEKKSWFYDLKEDEKPADSNLSQNKHTRLNSHSDYASLDPGKNDEAIKSTTNSTQASTYLHQNDLLPSFNLRRSQTDEVEAKVTNIHDNFVQNSCQQKNRNSADMENVHESLSDNPRSSTTGLVVEPSISSSSGNIEDSRQSIESTAARKQTPLQLLGQTTNQLGTQISREDNAVKSEQVSLISSFFPSYLYIQL